MSTIESSVTRLLVSTKHLLESLTQWARQEADDKFVSDAYVKLGNDFRAATRAFTAAGVDISDLGDVPRALRIVLESALSEAPTQENLDRFLPNIRNIIVSLLSSLKLKQSKAVALASEMQAHQESSTQQQQQQQQHEFDERRSPHRHVARMELHMRSASSLSERFSVDRRADQSIAQSPIDPSTDRRFDGKEIEARTVEGDESSWAASQKAKVNSKESGNFTERDDDSIKQPGQDVKSPLAAEFSDPSADRALAQLQKENVILRRASKRFSAYQFAKLTNFSGNVLPKISAESSNIVRDSKVAEHKDDTHPEDIKVLVNENANTNTNSSTTANTNSKGAEYIFLRIKESTKKCAVLLPISMTSLRLLFVEKFAYSPGVSSFPEIYIVDPKTSVSYELEETAIQTDLISGSLVELKEQAPKHNGATLSTLESKLVSLESQMQSLSTRIISDVSDQISKIEIPMPVLLVVEAGAGAGAVVPGSFSRSETQENDYKAPDAEHVRIVAELQQELSALKQMHRTKNEATREIFSDLSEQISLLKLSCLETGSQNTHRTFMQHSYSKLSEESDTLLTKVDDLQDMMEALRKDVAQRGVRLGPKQLKATAKEILDAEDSLKALIEYINEGKPSWKKIWESELDKVCEEQQFFNLQDDLTRDLDEDINKIKETFELIEKCSSEQSKQPPLKKNNFAAKIPMLEPGDSIHGVKDAILSEVNLLVPDHASRLDAIERAERLRVKEREIESLNPFQEELGDFVADQKLKKSGGIEEIERMRQERDLENFKSTFGIV